MDSYFENFLWNGPWTTYYGFPKKSLIYQFIHHWNFLTLGDTIERGDRAWKEAQRQGEDMVTLWITLM